jgi:hypothetical protein
MAALWLFICNLRNGGDLRFMVFFREPANHIAFVRDTTKKVL